jgi:uncharacterized membrane protein
MNQAIENYNSPSLLPLMRKQAWKVWAIGLVVIAFWLFLILLAPIAEASSLTSISAPLYNFFGFICHQFPNRSFHILEHKFGVCSRCFGVYFGLLTGFIIYPLFRTIEEIEPLPRFWLFLAMIPIGVDWSLTVFGIWENTFFTRFTTGLILGAACGVFIVPALVEIVRLLRRKYIS